MPFDLPPEHLELHATVRKIAQDKVAPRASAIDTTAGYPQDLFDLFRETGLLGLVIPEEYGGSGAGILGLTVAIEEVAKYSTKAAPDGDGWVLNGTKCWMSGVVQADWYCVFAKTGPADSRSHADISCFIVDRASDGASVGRTDDKMGVRGIDTGELILDDVRVPECNVVGEIGGFRLAMLGLNSMRPIVAARGIGLAEGALMYAVEYVKQRAAFGKTIADMQGIQWKIAELATEIEAARLLTYRSAVMADEGKYTQEYVPFLSMAKYYASEIAVKVSGE